MKIGSGWPFSLHKKIRRSVPKPHSIRGTWLHQKLGDGLFCKTRWVFDKKTVPWGISIGIFWAMMPIPFQMIPSAITAFFMKANVPSAMISVWITNPLTWPAILWGQYVLGRVICEGVVKWGLAVPDSKSLALLVGCFVTAIPLSLSAFLLTKLIVNMLPTRKKRTIPAPLVQNLGKNL